jgi:RNA polymerase sigma-70 factor (sigma-E family)
MPAAPGAVDQTVTVALHAPTDSEIAELFEENATALVRLARLFVDHRDAAEDIVQEAFLRMAKARNRVRDPEKVPAYLRSIVLNLARDHNRRGLLSLRHIQTHTELDPSSVEETHELADDQQRMLDALNDLPRRQRDCLTLRYLYELGVPEIAETFGLSANSVKTHLTRGLRALRNRLDVK